MFCPKCGNILRAKKEKDGTVFVCDEHGVVEAGEQKLKEKITTKKKAVMFLEDDAEVHPKVEAECPKCGHREAYFWTVQTRGADESPTRFYKCIKCSNIWREYS